MNLILEQAGIQQASIKTLINAVLQLFNYFMALTSALFVDRIGRRTLFLISNCGMLVSLGLWTMCAALYEQTKSEFAGHATIGVIFLYFGFYDIAYSPLLVAYTVEILPFSIRAKGFAVMNLTVSIALIFNQYVNPVAYGKLRWKYYLFYVAWLAFELVFIYLYLVETKGRTLEQTAALFDGEGAETDLQEISAESYRHRSIVSDSTAHQHNVNLSPRSEKYYQGERFEMSPATTKMQQSQYDWDRVYVERDEQRDSFTSPPQRSNTRKKSSTPRYY